MSPSQSKVAFSISIILWTNSIRVQRTAAGAYLGQRTLLSVEYHSIQQFLTPQSYPSYSCARGSHGSESWVRGGFTDTLLNVIKLCFNQDSTGYPHYSPSNPSKFKSENRDHILYLRWYYRLLFDYLLSESRRQLRVQWYPLQSLPRPQLVSYTVRVEIELVAFSLNLFHVSIPLKTSPLTLNSTSNNAPISSLLRRRPSQRYSASPL